MRKIISPIDPESIFTQDIGLHFFNEAPRSAEIELSELGPYSHSRGFALKGLDKDLDNNNYS